MGYADENFDLTDRTVVYRVRYGRTFAADAEGVRRDRGRLLEWMRLASFDPAPGPATTRSAPVELANKKSPISNSPFIAPAAPFELS